MFKTTKRALAVLLAVLMLVCYVPFASVAEGETSETWTMTPITDNSKGVTKATQIIFQDDEGFVLNWSPANPTIGRNIDAWWAGVKFTAPNKDIAQTAEYTNNPDGPRKSFKEFKDGEDWMGAWVPVTVEYVQGALKKSGYLGFSYKFYNDASDTTGTAFNVYVNVKNIKLMKNGELVMQTFGAKDATCTKDGNIAYYVDAEGTYYALDENKEFQEIALADTVIAAKHNLEPTAANAATCTDNGNTAYYTCSDCGKYFSDAEGKNEIEADSWVTEAEGHSLTPTEATEATCTENGNSAYWYCNVCEKYFSDEAATTETTLENATIPALGHNVDASKVEYFFDNAEDGGLLVTASGTCKRCRTHLEEQKKATWNQTAEATCEEAEKGFYTAEFSFVKYTGNVMDGQPALGHNYQFEKFVWSEDGTTATAHYICQNNNEHTQDYDANITSAVTPATCTAAAFTTYTARYKEKTDTNDVEDPTSAPLNHDFTVKADKSNVTADATDPAKHVITCARCGVETQSVACDFRLVENSNTADCENPGTQTYQCSVCGREKKEPTAALGHDYGNVTYRSEGNNIKAIVSCFRCEKTFSETKPIQTEETAATCKTEGTRVSYAAFDNDIFNDKDADGNSIGKHIVKTETLTVDLENHVGATEIRNAVTANCHAAGYTGDTYCLGCDSKIQDGEEIAIDANNHDGATETRDAVTANCHAAGYTGDTYCTGCNSKLQDGEEIAIDANNHVGGSTWYLEDSEESTYTTEGYKYWVLRCDDCNAVLDEKTETFDVIPHNHIYTTKDIAPTCEKEGTRIFTCTLCGHEETETLAKLQHEDKNNDGKCDNGCGQMMTGGNHCKYCGKIHDGLFGWLVGFFHSILAIFKR